MSTDGKVCAETALEREKTDAQAKTGSAKQQHLRNFLAIPNSNKLHRSYAKL
jgi:hypothetical protein